MQCPKCDYLQADNRSICENCGIVFAKYQALQQDIDYAEELVERHRGQFELHSVDPEGWAYLGIGICVGLGLFFMDLWLVQATIGALITLIHEMGHAAVSWLFGAPAMPAFDFRHGGGMTMSFDQRNDILIAIYAAIGYGLYHYRRNGLTLVILLALLVFHLGFAFSRLSEVFVLFMGHGTELVIATIFIYRGMSNSAIVHRIERPMYASIGFYIIFHDIGFAWKLMHDAGYRVEYEAQKGGYHFGDFSRIAEQHLGTDLSFVAGMFLALCIATPIFAFLLWRYEEAWTDWLHDRISTTV